MPELINKQSVPSAPAKSRGQKKKRTAGLIALTLAVALLAGGGFALYRFLGSTEEAQGEVFSQPAMIGTIQSKVSGSGTAKAKESAAITLTQSGVVEEVFITSGQTVMAGDPLYSIYSQAAQDQVTHAQLKVDALNSDLSRLLEERGALTVTAPFAGKLQNVQSFELDSAVGSGTPVATLVNDRQLKLHLYFSYAYEHDIYVGQEVSVSVPVVMGTFKGRIEKIYNVSYISPEGGVHFEVEIVFDNPGTLTAGMEAAASLKTADGSPIYPYENSKLEFSSGNLYSV